MDNEHERNEHFKGFAELLAEEIEQVGYRTVPGHDNLPISYGHWEEAIRLLIAQRAYDLMYFLLDKAPLYSGSFDVGWGTPSEIHETIERLPALTEWPKTPLEASAPDE